MKAKPIRLFDYEFSGNGYKIRLALSQLKLPIEIEYLDILKGETWTEDFFTKNPMGQIPVLELSDGKFLRESNAILFWLGNDTYLLPDDLDFQTLVLQWMFFEQSNIDKILGRTRFLKAFPDFMETTSKDWEIWYSTGNRALAVLNAHLASVDFLVHGVYSIADICLYGYVHTADEGGFNLAEYPAIERWLSRVSNTAGYIPQFEDTSK
ncbi:MAG: glutathione S-transferase family protein [Gammaproteobacteria bacterium]|nr:glutathione S-transferase family protein [Pseudomonadales bacterium]